MLPSVPANVSATVAPVTTLGPLLVATIEYVMVWPGMTAPTCVFVTARSACGVTATVSVDVLFAGLVSVTPAGAATVAVFTRFPVAAADNVAVTVKVTLPLTGRFTLALMFPEPLAGHVPPPAPAQVQLMLLSVAGNVSATVAPVTALGPLFDATIE